MNFEFDEAKSETTKRKHGITLREATQIWRGPYLEIEARTVDEPRWMALGLIRDKLYACIYTIRSETVRLISCRRARPKEAQLYHGYFRQTGREGHSQGG